MLGLELSYAKKETTGGAGLRCVRGKGGPCMSFRGGEFSAGTTGNFQPELTQGLGKERSDNREHRRCGTKSLLFPPSFPILIGQGIPLIQPRHRSIRLKLLSTKAFPDGVVLLHYRTTPHS